MTLVTKDGITKNVEHAHPLSDMPPEHKEAFEQWVMQWDFMDTVWNGLSLVEEWWLDRLGFTHWTSTPEKDSNAIPHRYMRTAEIIMESLTAILLEPITLKVETPGRWRASIQDGTFGEDEADGVRAVFALVATLYDGGRLKILNRPEQLIIEETPNANP